MSPRQERAWLGFYRFLLRSWPEEVRDEVGEDLLLIFRDRLHDAWPCSRLPGRIRFSWRVLCDVIGSGLKERQDRLFGARTLLEEAARRRNRQISPEERARITWFDALRQDVRFGLRMMVRNPLFTAAAVLCLGIGIGANATIFGFLYGVMGNPLRLEEPQALVACEPGSIEEGWTTSGQYPDFLEMRRQNSSFEALTAWHEVSFTLTAAGMDPERVPGLSVTPDFSRVMRVEPLIGRGFMPDDETPGAPAVVILGHRFWTRRFGADPGIIGRTMTLDGETRTIVGVMPDGFRFPTETRLWVPIRRDRGLPRGCQYLRFTGRLNPEVTIDQAAGEMQEIAADLARRFPESNSHLSMLLFPLEDDILGDIREVLLIFYVVVTFVLMLACANVANLLLARSSTRQRELTIRAGLGAGRFRLMRMFLTEAIVLAALGGVLGLILGRVGRDLIVNGIPVALPYWVHVEMHLPVVAVMTLITFLASLLAGAGPVWLNLRADVAGRLKEGGERAAGSRRSSAFRQALVTIEVGLALVLLIGASLMLHGVARLHGVEPGFSTENVLTMRLELPLTDAGDPVKTVRMYEDILDRIRAHPAVSAAAAATIMPFAESNESAAYLIEGGPVVGRDRAPDAYYRVVTPEHFSTLEIPLLSGREFERSDYLASADQVAIVDRRFADQNWPGLDPVGRRIRHATADTAAAPAWMTVVGVVETICQRALLDETLPTIYRPLAQLPRTANSLEIRTTGDPLEFVRPMRDILFEVDPDLAPFDVMTMEQHFRQQNWEPAVYGWMFGVFSSIALLLAMIGVYGVVACSVSERAREFGIRIALGAGPGPILRLVVNQGARPVGLGLLAGTVLAFIVLRFAASIFFGVSATEPLFYLVAITVMAGVALLATWLPARRATAVDPVASMRVE